MASDLPPPPAGMPINGPDSSGGIAISVNACGFNRRSNPVGSRLNALFISDIGHVERQAADVLATAPGRA